MSAPRPASPGHRATVALAIERLKQARTLAAQADCPRLVRKIHSAIKSGGGAERHLSRRIRYATTANERTP
jgi:hypothetical protein